MRVRSILTVWDAGAPNFRWLEIAYAGFGKAMVPPSPRYSRGMAMMNVAIYDATVAAWEAKYTYNRPRLAGTN